VDVVDLATGFWYRAMPVTLVYDEAGASSPAEDDTDLLQSFLSAGGSCCSVGTLGDTFSTSSPLLRFCDLPVDFPESEPVDAEPSDVGRAMVDSIVRSVMERRRQVAGGATASLFTTFLETTDSFKGKKVPYHSGRGPR